MDDLDLGATIRGFSPGQKVFGRYTLKSMLGRGGMGVVWRAFDESLGREVAIKLLPEMVANDPAAIRDLKRETARSQQLSHPHILRIYDFAEQGSVCGITMELVEGGTLTQRRLEQPGEVFEVAELGVWVGQLCEALDYAHGKVKIVHRDLKPANLMVDGNGDLKIADFGIAASLSESVTRASRAVGTSGTPLYMSPQQMMGEAPAVTDDVYALGATLYELLTGKPPFYRGKVEMQVMNAVPVSLVERRAELGVVAGVGDPGIPVAWEETIAACLAKEAGERPQSAGEVWERLKGGKAEKLKGGKAESKTTERTEKPERLPTVGARQRGNGAAGGGALERSVRETTSGAPWAREEQHTEDTARKGGGNPGKVLEKPRRGKGVGLVAMVGLALAGWWFGVHAPEQRRLEGERLATARLQAEAARTAAERAEATRLEEARLAAERETARVAAERLANARGGVVVDTEPSGAEVLVGGFARERTPATLRDVRLGTYPVVARLEGYEEINGTVEVKENEFATVNLTLVRSTGDLQIASNPPGLEAMVEGRNVAGAPAARPVRTPAKLEGLPTGTYTVTYRRPDWPEQVQTVKVERRATASALGEFVGGGLQVTSRPSGAEVWAGGKRLGVTPLSFSDLTPGNFEFEFRLERHRSATRSGRVVARETTRVEAVLEERRGPQAVQPYENTLGMKFVPVAGTGVLFSIWETRVQDFEVFVRETGHDATQGMLSDRGDGWKQQGDTWRSPGFPQGPTHPVVGVNQADAKAFCEWLTKRERAAGRLEANQSYRLPTDAEWDAAVGRAEFPWGNQWPPPRGAGNYADEAAKRGRYKSWTIISGYDDGYDATAPVGSFTANTHGIYDLGGNVWEYVDDRAHGLRGASFSNVGRGFLASSYRYTSVSRYFSIGFRVVVVVGSVR